MRPPVKLLILLSPVVLLTACAATTIPEFETEQTTRDVVHDASALQNVNADSTRFVGEVDDYVLYLAWGDNDTLCIVQMRDEAWESTSCGAGFGLGIELTNGALVEAGNFSFPKSRVGDAERTNLSESVSVISKP